MPQTVLTVFEDRPKKIDLTTQQQSDILAMRPLIDKSCLSLSCDGYLHVRHYVGFVSKGKTRLQILPKVYEDTGLSGEEEQRESMRAMLNLLRVSEFNKILELPEQSSFAEQSDILEVFIGIFAHKVFQTYSRQMNREYITVTENSAFIKGHIEFAENLRQNPIRRDRHLVSYESFEHNNIINNVIKSVCVKLIQLAKDPENKKRLKKALVFLDDAKAIPLSKDLIDSARFTRLNMPFKPVYEMAKMFFYNLAPQSYQGDDTVCSFLIPLNELFEYYLFKLFDTFGDGYRAYYQNKREFAVSEQSDFRVTVRPDIVLKQNKRTVFIADAKYKNPAYQNGTYKSISQADIYQVFAYAKIYGLSSVALLYPQFSKTPPPAMEITLKDADSDIRLTVGCVDIKNPNIESSSCLLRQTLFSPKADIA